MTVQQLRQMHSARPFRAFDLYTADSRVLTIEHPEQLALSEIGRTIAVARPDGTIETIDLLLVVSLKPRANGTARRARQRS
jgi:hypothetical protein